MAFLDLFWSAEKKYFFEKYKKHANEKALEEIWYVKENKVSHLDLNCIEITKHFVTGKIYYSDTGIKINDLTPLCGLSHLVSLAISGSQVNDLSPLKDLRNLEGLHLDNTLVKDLSTLKYLLKLKTLNLNNTQVNDFRPLSNLLDLKYIELRNTRIKDLNPLKKLINLKSVDIQETQVNDLTPLKHLIKNGLEVDGTFSRGLPGIYIANTPLVNPPKEIANRGNDAILNYWKEIRFKTEKTRVGSRKINEARLLLLGQGGTGKTSLKEKMRDKNAPLPEPDETTRGINIESIVFQNEEQDDFIVHVWDFGGQNIQKYAHQFFMSDSVVYAVLTDERKQDRNFNYWFSIIELLGKNSPFYIVQNERDRHFEPLNDLLQIQERYPKTLKGILPVNLKNAAKDWRFDNLRLALLKTATELPHTQHEYLNSFFNIRQKLSDLGQTQQTLPFKEFRQLCRDEGIIDVELANDYAVRFTELGIALHFDENIHLRTQIFLNPKWLIDSLFQLLYHPKLEQQNGLFSETDAYEIWSAPQYDDLHGVLTQLMIQFQICFETTIKGHFIVPQRLPIRTQVFIPPADTTFVVYSYKFLPNGFLTQLTCSLHHLIENEKVWSDAVQFIDKNKGRVFVRANEADHKIEIFGFEFQKANLLNRVVDALDKIHTESKFDNLRIEKLVPCPCKECAVARQHQQESMFFNYDFLLELLNEGELEGDRCKISKKKFPIRTILKQSNMRVFTIDRIKKLLANDKIEQALNLLKGRYDEDNDVIVQLSRIARLNRETNIGLQTDAFVQVERNKIINGVLAMIKEWEAE